MSYLKPFRLAVGYWLSRAVALTLVCSLQGLTSAAQAACDQISPNPNPIGHTITNVSSVGCNNGNVANQFQKFGTLNNTGTLNNSGQFLIAAGGGVTGTGIYTQTAGTTVVDGSMTQGAVKIGGGVLQGIGSITGPVTVDGGTIASGNSSGTLTIHGDLTFEVRIVLTLPTRESGGGVMQQYYLPI